jgi:tryptophan synthase alpha chain
MKKLMAHVYCGDGGINFSEKLIRQIGKNIDVLELGIPFSDPIADGAVFQAACQRALENKTVPEDVFNLVKNLRKDGFGIPIILTTYYNIIFNLGIKEFVKIISKAGINGVIVPDLPFEESIELHKACKNEGIDLIFIIAPTTTDERMKKILKKAEGFVYLVSVAGVTGSGKGKKQEINRMIGRIRKYSNISVFLGFGIRSREDIAGINANGFIVGSELKRRYDSGIGNAAEFIQLLKRECAKSVCK